VAWAAFEWPGQLASPGLGRESWKQAVTVDGENDDGARGMVEKAHDPSGALIVKLSGEIDMSNAESLGRAIDELIDPGTAQLVIDLTGLDFMDSSGIAMLLRVTSDVDSVNLRNPSNVIRRIIESTGLGDVLRVES
jgi:anti-anti-sigma factor